MDFLVPAVAVVGAAFAAPLIVTGVVLPAVGFGSAGVAAGSLAAAWQASIGNVVAPSIFAALQSAAAGGYAAATVAQVAGAVTAAGGAAVVVAAS